MSETEADSRVNQGRYTCFFSRLIPWGSAVDGGRSPLTADARSSKLALSFASQNRRRSELSKAFRKACIIYTYVRSIVSAGLCCLLFCCFSPLPLKSAPAGIVVVSVLSACLFCSTARVLLVSRRKNHKIRTENTPNAPPFPLLAAAAPPHGAPCAGRRHGRHRGGQGRGGPLALSRGAGLHAGPVADVHGQGVSGASRVDGALLVQSRLLLGHALRYASTMTVVGACFACGKWLLGT